MRENTLIAIVLVSFFLFLTVVAVLESMEKRAALASGLCQTRVEGRTLWEKCK